MNLKQAVSDLIVASNQLEDRRYLENTIIIVKEVLNSFWAYKQIVTPALEARAADAAQAVYNLKSGEINLTPENIESAKRKIILFASQLSQFIKANPQIAALELVSQNELKAAMIPFRLLVVCIANATRSPAMENSIRTIAAATGLEKLEVRSCGIWNLINLNSQERERLPLLEKKLGIKIGGNSIPASNEICAWANLILTASPFISKTLLNNFPAAKGKVLTVKEFLGVPASSIWAFYMDDPGFSLEREKALDAWYKSGKKSYPEFIETIKKEIAEGKRKPFMYRGQYIEHTMQGKAVAASELFRISIAIVENLVQKNYLLTKPELKAHLVYRLNSLR